ncbi:MAG: hypothetical protein R3D58_07070 [Saprospiraceae bacterium]
MFENLQDTIAHVAAAVFGWVFMSIPRVFARQMSWAGMFASIGLAGTVGFIAGSILHYVFPQWPANVVCSITSVLGATCQHWMIRFTKFADKAADRVEEATLDMINEPGNPEQNEGESPK